MWFEINVSFISLTVANNTNYDLATNINIKTKDHLNISLLTIQTSNKLCIIIVKLFSFRDCLSLYRSLFSIHPYHAEYIL